MKVLRTWDLKDYDPAWRRFVRSTARAIIPGENGTVAMVRSTTDDFYLFPGGGVKKYESRTDALIRETKEETGLIIIPDSIRELGMFREIRRSIYPNEIFDQRSYYYAAEVKPCRAETSLEAYEKKLGFELCYIHPGEAYDVNIVIAKKRKLNFLFRESEMLRELRDKKISGII
ncbi:MAG: NUDIX domain-containing protein [Clostridia bacterium]|nr:NUDIX domain-containing protein [Clostridia bacterium]MBR5284362.1 NUDIX domain-containing protein [Clostridia bacterium]